MSIPAPTAQQMTAAEFSRGGFLVSLSLLVCLGIIMVFTSTTFARSLEFEPIYFQKHLLFVLISAAACVAVSRIQRSWMIAYAPWLFVVGVIVLVLVLIPGVGVKINGARRWFRIGPISLQPSELMKILLPLFLCWWSQQSFSAGLKSKFIPCLLLIGVPVIIAVEPDLGTAVMVFVMGAVYLFLSGWPWRLFLGVACSVIPVLFYLMLFQPYQLARISAYVQALGDWQQAQYQVKQSLLSMASGRTWGTGLGFGLQKLSFLPESHTDFIFAVIGEELGLVGMLAVITIWLLILLFGSLLVWQARHEPEWFSLAGTLLIGILLQAAINCGVVTSMLPPKGISHPLLSYGGSNLLATMIACGLILNITRRNGHDHDCPNIYSR